ncbi:iron-containing redox enzyme family protein [Vineibacter terrae]|uniref:Iron-containing redox enzyme family protein n=1 Tax=Vineibacter terrae TaxID=2586908 RepID=A0A5C8PT82_9HYPH|nr:iron-containing redox enzyme family protein [Vineibacter terrae]TXL80282.1 iron-containing redox enzyme family protein [Vineibacter terrae]
MAKSEFRTQIEEVIQQRHSKTHPWSDAWVSGRLNRRLLGEWTKQHFHYVSLFPQWCATVYGDCPAEDVRAFIAENIMEEEGMVGQEGFPAIKHTELLLDFGEHCGMGRDEIRNAQLNGELLPETLGLQSWCYRQSQRHYVEAMAALLVGLESQVPQIYSRTTPPLLEKYGFTQDEVVFFTLHIVADAEHGERGFEILERHATTPELRSACLRLVREATLMRRLYLDGLYAKFLAQPQAQAAA